MGVTSSLVDNTLDQYDTFPEELIMIILSHMKAKTFVNMRLINKCADKLVLTRCNRLVHFKIPHNNPSILKPFNTNPNVCFVLYNNDTINGVKSTFSPFDIDNIFTALDINKIVAADLYSFGSNIHNQHLSMLTNMTYLRLHKKYNFNSSISDKTLKKLINITKLDLIDDDDMIDIGISILTNINELYLNHTNIWGEKLKRLTNITKLSLQSCHLIGDSVRYLTNITDLRVIRCKSFDNNVLKLMTNVNKLDISYDSDFANYGISKLTNIMELNISGANNITYDGLKHFTKLRSLTSRHTLRNYDIYNSRKISSLTSLISLTSLDLTYDNPITSDDYDQLINLSSLKNLRELHLCGNLLGHLSNAERIKCPHMSHDLSKRWTNLTKINIYEYRI